MTYFNLYKQGQNFMEDTRNLKKAFGEDRTYWRWFEKFKDGHFDISDESRSGRPFLVMEIIEKKLFSATTDMQVIY